MEAGLTASSRVVRQSTFDGEPEATAVIEGLYRGGLACLEQVLESR